MAVEIVDSVFDPWLKIQEYQKQKLPAGRYGATAVFIGTMREFNEAQDVQSMVLEHYPGMTEKFLNDLSENAAQRWELLDTLIVHRVGELQPDEPIVLVAVWSVHRKQAFEANRYLMEELKSNAPFWKKEQIEGDSRWIDKNTPGY